jgi:hypothetical protein
MSKQKPQEKPAQSQQGKIIINHIYDAQSDSVQIWVTPLAMIKIPWEIYFNGFYETKRLRDQSQSGLFLLSRKGAIGG